MKRQIIAILRGITPAEVETHVETLIEQEQAGVVQSPLAFT